MKRIVTILAALFTALTVMSQSTGTGTIEGFITTPDGKAVANVNVSIKSLKNM
ncbi:hypothetical protein KRR40_23770 [Niabella defluvii]|nr:hypothetical protein KRR40_23770 [Niabella sp. I65]